MRIEELTKEIVEWNRLGGVPTTMWNEEKEEKRNGIYSWYEENAGTQR